MQFACVIRLFFVGFLCGRCNSTSNEGTALDLIECVSCEGWHNAIFVIICKFNAILVIL